MVSSRRRRISVVTMTRATVADVIYETLQNGYRYRAAFKVFAPRCQNFLSHAFSTRFSSIVHEFYCFRLYSAPFLLRQALFSRSLLPRECTVVRVKKLHQEQFIVSSRRRFTLVIRRAKLTPKTAASMCTRVYGYIIFLRIRAERDAYKFSKLSSGTDDLREQNPRTR